MIHDSCDEWWESHEILLREFAIKIQNCVANSNWQELISVLQSRQSCLEEMFSAPVPKKFSSALRSLVTEILEQDAMFQAQVEVQKNALVGQLADLKRSQLALQAYKDQ